MLILYRSTKMQNFWILAWRMTELLLFEKFGIWYELVLYGMVWYSIVGWYYIDLLTCKISESYLEERLSYCCLKNLVFGMIWYFMVWYGMVCYSIVGWYYIDLITLKISESYPSLKIDWVMTILVYIVYKFGNIGGEEEAEAGILIT